MTSCKDLPEIYPLKNSQPSGTYSQTKEEVEAAVNAGYYYLRTMVEPSLPYSVGGIACRLYFYNQKGSNLQNFQVKPSTDKDLCNRDALPNYQCCQYGDKELLILQSRRYIRLAGDEVASDRGLFLARALCYFYLVRASRKPR